MRAHQAAGSFAQKNCSSVEVVASKVNHRHGNLHSPLQPSPFWLGRVMPELFKNVMSGVPLTTIEELNTAAEAGIAEWIQAQRLAVFLEGNLRRRIDSGVTSSISSGPMYSRARSKVI